MNISRIAENYAVSPQINRDDVAALKAAGFDSIICNRPDGEEPGQPDAEDIRIECQRLELAFHHIPVTGVPIDDASINAHRRAIETSAGPVLAYCRSGQRSLIIWQASA